MKISDFDFDLPPELIAQDPLPERDTSRMMVVFRKERRWAHASFRDLPDYLAAGDLMVSQRYQGHPGKGLGQSGRRFHRILFVKQRALSEWRSSAARPGVSE